MSIKVLGVSGSPVKEETDLEFLLQGVLNAARRQGGNVQVEVIRLADVGLSKGCIHCDWCLRHQTEEKFCSQNDGMEEIYPRVVEADAIVVATPVSFGRIGWLLTCFFDRLKALAEGRFYGVNGPMDGVLIDKTMAGCVLAKLGQDGSESALQTILMTAGLYGMIPVTLPKALGVKSVGTVSSSHKGAVKEDRVAMATAQNIGARLVQTAQTIKAGKEALRYFPAYLR